MWQLAGQMKPVPIRERAQADLQSAEKKLKAKLDDPSSRLARAIAYFQLGENQKALDEFQVVIAKNPEAVIAKEYRIVALARLRRKQDAMSEPREASRRETPQSTPSSTWALSSRPNWARVRIRHLTTWTLRSGTNPRIQSCDMTPPVPFAKRQEPSPARTRQWVVDLRSDVFAIAQGGDQEQRCRLRKDG